MLGKCFIVMAVLCAFSCEFVEGKRVLLRPIPAAKVRQILRSAGREDALPEGRVISHGLAAINGFALGLKKGVLGVALADSLASLSGTTGAGNSSTVTGEKPSFSYNGTSNQLCFTSRSATSDIVASGDAEARATPTTTATTTMPTTTSTDVTSPTTTDTATGTGTGTNTVTNTATTTESTGGAVNCIVFDKS